MIWKKMRKITAIPMKNKLLYKSFYISEQYQNRFELYAA